MVGSLQGSSLLWLSANYWVALGTEWSDCRWSRQLNTQHRLVSRAQWCGQNQQISLEKRQYNLKKVQRWWDCTDSPGMGSEVQSSQSSGTVRQCPGQCSLLHKINRPAFGGCHKLASSGNFSVRSMGPLLYALCDGGCVSMFRIILGLGGKWWKSRQCSLDQHLHSH